MKISRKRVGILYNIYKYIITIFIQLLFKPLLIKKIQLIQDFSEIYEHGMNTHNCSPKCCVHIILFIITFQKLSLLK